MKVAAMTFSILRAPYGDPLVQEFDDRTPDVFQEAESWDGFIDRAVVEKDVPWLSNHQKNWGKWGPYAVPRNYLDGTVVGQETQVQTLSIWCDLLSLRCFVYKGPLHTSALKRKKNWFGKQPGPIYVVWWIDNDHCPTWREACSRLESLQDYGPTPFAFNFKKPFDENGKQVDTKVIISTVRAINYA